MTIPEIETFLTENKDNDDVKKFVGGFYSSDRLNPFLDSDAGLKIIQARLDKNFNKGLETWKKNNLPGLIESEVTKRNPELSPEQKRLKELELKIKETEAANLRERLTNFASNKLSELKIPVTLASFIVGEDEKKTSENLELLKSQWDGELEKRVNEVFKLNGRKKPGPTDKKTPGTKMNDFIRQSAGR